METKTLYKVETVRDRLRLTARLSAFSPIVLGIVVFFFNPWMAVLGTIPGVITAGIAWFTPWLGGVLMMLLTGPGFYALFESNWDFSQKLPYYIFDVIFFISGLLHIMVSVLGWITRVEWPFKKQDS
jgi:hypothetical protein